MKKLVLFVFLFASFQAFGQFPNYTNINGRYKWIAGKFDSTFTIPSGTTPSLRTGGGTGPGALFYRTTDSTVYQYTGTQWIKLRAGVNPSDTAGIWISNVYRKTGTDSVYYVKGGTSTFAFRDSIGNVGGGGGGGKIYYFNGGVSMGTFGGISMYELGDTAVTSAAANFTRSTTGNLANFITDVNRPGLLQIPAGVWTVDAYLSETGGGSNHAQIWVKVEKWNGSTITDIATSPIEEITNGSVIDLYTWAVSIPTTTLTVTDRIIIQFYITNTNGKTVTLYTQNGYVGEVHTTFTTGIGSLNGLTAPTQYFATGTSGTDFAISSSTATHTFNLPTASGTNRGALSSADWTTFNGKVGGSGTTNYVSKFTASGTIGNSQIFDNGTNVGIATTSPQANTLLTIQSTANANQVSLCLRGPSTDVNRGGGLFMTGSDGTSHLYGFYSDNLGLTSYTTASTYIMSISFATGISGKILGNSTGLYIRSDASRELNFGSNNSNDRMIIKSGGNVLIGTTTDAGYKLDVNGTFRSTLDANINGLTVGKGGGSVATSTAIGFEAMNATVTGAGNVAVGYRAGKAITSGVYNAFVGYDAGTSVNTGSYNYGFGMFAGRFLTSGVQNVLLGYNAGAALTTQSNNVFIGHSAGDATTAGDNTAIGFQAMQGNTTGTANTALGYRAGYGITTGTYNTIIGTGATGNGITTGNYNTIIGSQVTGLSSSLSNTIILADGQGNQRFTINSSGNAGILTTSPTNLLTLVGSTTGRGIDFVSQANFATVTGKINYETTNDLFSIINASSWGNSALIFGTNNTERARFTVSGRLLIGTSTESTYILDANGTVRVQGTELRLDNGTTGVINLYSATPVIQFAAGTGDGYSIGRTSTNMNIKSNGAILMYIGANQSYQFDATNGHLFRSGIAGSTTWARLTTGGNFMVGTSTDEASAVLQATSTTKGFLPPRMTGAQAELIGTPAAGLMVYSTDGSGATITSLGWWGYNGTTWVKLN